LKKCHFCRDLSSPRKKRQKKQKKKKNNKKVQNLRDFPELPERKRNKTEKRKHIERFSTEFINSIVSAAASGGKSRRCNAVLGIA
jgi:hypothetical protein